LTFFASFFVSRQKMKNAISEDGFIFLNELS